MFFLWSGMTIDVQHKSFCFMLNYVYMCFPYKNENSSRARTMFYTHSYPVPTTVPGITQMTNAMIIELISTSPFPPTPG